MHRSDLYTVKAAYLEPTGAISVLENDASPRVVEVEVEAGVQRVRIEFV